MNFGNVDLMGIFVNWFPMLLLIGVWVFFLRKMKGGTGFAEAQSRQLETMERIAAALEKIAQNGRF